MSVRTCFNAAAALLATVFVAAPPVVATPPVEVTFFAVADFSGPEPDLTWTSVGAVSDGGEMVFGETLWAAVPSPVVGTLHQEVTFVGDLGEIRIRAEGVFRPSSTPGIATLTGHLRVMEGTGAYEGMHGGGEQTIVFNADPDVPDLGTFTGNVHAE
jgi:hypothetical protein